MTNREYIGASVFSVCTFTIGFYVGNKLSENKFRPKFKNLLERIEYLENGITKS